LKYHVTINRLNRGNFSSDRSLVSLMKNVLDRKKLGYSIPYQSYYISITIFYPFWFNWLL